MSEQAGSHPSREWTKFIVLAVILLGVIVVVAATRPFIFNHVVPAIMGEGQRSAPLPAETEPLPTEAPATAEETATVEETVPMDGENGETEASATAVPTLTHIIQPGETLYQIGRSYNVSVADLIAANNLPNPNNIQAGTPLLIPQP